MEFLTNPRLNQSTNQPINQSTDQPINQSTYQLLSLADSTLIMSQRLSEWTGNGPALELDIALTNIALDYLGQARNFYQYTAVLLNAEGTEDTEDSLAYLREERDFKNHLLVELPNADWAQTMLKVFFFAAYQKGLYQQLINCPDAQIAGIAAKSLKEVQYHLRWSSDWIIRLGDGTDESHDRLKNALENVWMFTGEFFEKPPYDLGWIDYDALRKDWNIQVENTFESAGLVVPVSKAFQTGGLNGLHTEHLGFILAEMQYLQRVYPNSNW